MNNQIYNLSQEEIDALMKEMENSLNSMNGIIKTDKLPEQLNFFDIPLPSESESKCNIHMWKTYQGLKETFDYCSICDQKR